jgi:hypothetical protein
LVKQHWNFNGSPVRTNFSAQSAIGRVRKFVGSLAFEKDGMGPTIGLLSQHRAANYHILQRCATRIERLFCDTISFDEEPDNDDAMAATLSEAAQPIGQVALIPVVPNARHRAAQIDGYSIHADVAVATDDRQGLARLLRYGARRSLPIVSPLLPMAK